MYNGFKSVEQVFNYKFYKQYTDASMSSFHLQNELYCKQQLFVFIH